MHSFGCISHCLKKCTLLGASKFWSMEKAPSNNGSKWMHLAIKYSKQQSHDEPAQPPPATKASGCTNHFQSHTNSALSFLGKNGYLSCHLDHTMPGARGLQVFRLLPIIALPSTLPCLPQRFLHHPTRSLECFWHLHISVVGSSHFSFRVE